MLAMEYRLEDELEAREEEGIERGIIKSAAKMLKAGIPLSDVAKILELSKEHIEMVENAAT